MPTFPQELIDVVLNLLFDDERTLRSCSVVASSFRATSQKHLFRSIDVYLDREAANNRLLSILLSNPRFCLYVQILAINLYGRPRNGSLAEILGMLPRIQSLRLCNNGFPPTRWRALSPNLKNGILLMMRTPILEELSLEYVDVPFYHIRFLSHLKHLSLPIVHTLAEEEYDLSPASPLASGMHSLPPQHDVGYLESLKAANSAECRIMIDSLTEPDSSLRLTRLRRYYGMVTSSDDLDPSQKVLDIAFKSLSSLVLRLNCEQRITNHLDLRNLQSLKFLELRLSGKIKQVCSDHLLRVLRALPQTTPVERLTLFGVSHFDLTPWDWYQLDDLLTSGLSIPPPQHVTIELYSRRSYIYEHVPKLTARGGLTIDTLIVPPAA